MGFADLFKVIFCRLIATIFIRVVLFRELFIRFFDFLGTGIFADAEDAVQIFVGHMVIIFKMNVNFCQMLKSSSCSLTTCSMACFARRFSSNRSRICGGKHQPPKSTIAKITKMVIQRKMCFNFICRPDLPNLAFYIHQPSETIVDFVLDSTRNVERITRIICRSCSSWLCDVGDAYKAAHKPWHTLH